MSEHITTEATVDEQLREFIDMISDSEPYQQFIDSQQRLQADNEAQDLLEDFQQKQQQLQQDFDQETLRELRELKQDMENNDTIREARQAETALVELFETTNDIISEKIGQTFAQTTGGGCC